MSETSSEIITTSSLRMRSLNYCQVELDGKLLYRFPTFESEGGHLKEDLKNKYLEAERLLEEL